ncbi:MAG: hypothetical protein MJK05_08040 [Nitrosopumilus sp.]|nr:hypothetical protein [Nitrosopumilus sp.]
MNIYIIFTIFTISSLGFGVNFVTAQVDPITDIGFLQSGILDTVENQFHISNEINIREFFNGNIVRVSGQTIEGFPYITYSKVINDKINTHGMIFINGEFVKLSFEEKVEQIINIEKAEDISILVQYTQRVYSEKFIQIDIKIYDKDQNKLNDFNQNYGFISNTDIKIVILDEEGGEFYSVNGTNNDRGLFSAEFLIPENSQRQTLSVTINAENENSISSKILQVFSLGQIPDDGSSSTP